MSAAGVCNLSAHVIRTLPDSQTLVAGVGVEPTSIRRFIPSQKVVVEEGVEPSRSAYRALRLPLHHTTKIFD